MDKYKPAVTKAVRLFFAGALWLGVGSMLLLQALSWLWELTSINRIAFAGSGVALAYFFYRFVFLKIVDKNLSRILPVKDKKCLFSFMPWKSYLLIPLMIAMGATLRHSALPKQYLAVLYTGIGLALIVSATSYVRWFLKEVRQ